MNDPNAERIRLGPDCSPNWGRNLDWAPKSGPLPD
jgi:hypothetical protein